MTNEKLIDKFNELESVLMNCNKAEENLRQLSILTERKNSVVKIKDILDLVLEKEKGGMEDKYIVILVKNLLKCCIEMTEESYKEIEDKIYFD